MTTTKLISFTALPNGIAPSGKLKLSVFVAGRYSTDPVSDQKFDLHTDFSQFADWPSMVSGFGVKLNGGSEIAADTVSAAPRSDLWVNLFPASTYLRPHAFDKTLKGLTFTTYSVKDVHTGLKSIYTYFAKKNPADWPSVEDLLDPDSPLRDL